MLGATVAALLFASYLLTLRLRFEGASRAHIIRVIIELWATFGLILVAFITVRRLLGAVPRSSAGGEFVSQFDQLRTLPTGQQAIVAGLVLLALVLFVHLLWSLNTVPRTAEASTALSEEDHE